MESVFYSIVGWFVNWCRRCEACVDFIPPGTVQRPGGATYNVVVSPLEAGERDRSDWWPRVIWPVWRSTADKMMETFGCAITSFLRRPVKKVV